LKKLIKLIDRIVSSTNAKIILDPFMGSGTTMVACELEGCGYVGIDMDVPETTSGCQT